MAQVPYSPVPNAEPSGQGLSPVNPNISSEAFGGGIGQAISGFGRAVEGAGDTMFKIALDMQTKTNEAQARQGAADYTIAVGKANAEFSAKSGTEAAAAYPTHVENLGRLRDQYKDRMSSPMATRLFDNQSLGALTHATINSASHVAAENKKTIIRSYDSAIDSAMVTIANNPDDEVVKNDAKDRLIKTIWDKNAVLGQSMNNEKDLRDAASAIAVTEITSVPPDQPEKAQELLTEKWDVIDSAKRVALRNSLDVSVRTNRADNISREIYSGALDGEGNLTKTVKELEVAGRAKAGDDPKLADEIVRQIELRNNRNLYVKRQEVLDGKQTIAGMMVDDNITSVKDLRNTPRGELAYQKIGAENQAKLSKQYASYIEARDRPFNTLVERELTGRAKNAPNEFLEVDLTNPELKLNTAQIKAFTAMQTKVRESQGKVVKPDRYRGILETNFGSAMKDLLVFERTRNKDNYDGFDGIITQSVNAWREEHGGVPPTDAQFTKDIAPIIMKTQTREGVFNENLPGWLGGGSQRSQMETNQSSSAYQKFVAKETALVKAAGKKVDRFEIDRAYTRQMFKDFAKEKQMKEGE